MFVSTLAPWRLRWKFSEMRRGSRSLPQGLMIDKLELLLHLARERHFGRAAQSAGVTQPTLSSAVKSLEDQFGVLIVERGSRFQGFTPEGERILAWSRQLTGDARAMRQEIEALRRNLSGELRVGVIPTSLPIIPRLTLPFRNRCRHVRLRVMSMASIEILAKLDNLEIDVGISYLDSEPLGRFKGFHLYDERYALLTTSDGPFADRESVCWSEAGRLPLCQLSSDMQNRRLIDRHLRDAGADPACSLESNSMLLLYAHVRTGEWASIIPVCFADEIAHPGRLMAIPIIDPTITHSVGLIMPNRETQTPNVSKFVRVAEKAFGRADSILAEG